MGFFLGLFSSATFGLIPLFTLPLLHAGVTAETALFYRFLIATLTLGGLLAARGERFRMRGVDLCKLAGMSVMYMLAALLFFWAFSYLPSGVAATIHFLYPVMVMLIMIVFFHERFSWTIALSIILAVSGVALPQQRPRRRRHEHQLAGRGHDAAVRAVQFPVYRRHSDGAHPEYERPGDDLLRDAVQRPALPDQRPEH